MGIESSIHGYHVYRSIRTPRCLFVNESDTIHDPFAVVEGSFIIMGHWVRQIREK